MKKYFWEKKDYLKSVQRRYKDIDWWIKPEV
jgi:hypothetical protein